MNVRKTEDNAHSTLRQSEAAINSWAIEDECEWAGESEHFAADFITKQHNLYRILRVDTAFDSQQITDQTLNAKLFWSARFRGRFRGRMFGLWWLNFCFKKSVRFERLLRRN